MITKDRYILVRVPFLAHHKYDAIEFSETPLSDEEIRRSTALLAERTYESPKIIVVGVVVIAIPGITAGKFRRRRRLVYKIRRDILKKDISISGVGDDEVELSAASKEELQNMKRELIQKKILFSSAEDDKGLAVIAVYYE